jgi:uncharacterized protein YhaN
MRLANLDLLAFGHFTNRRLSFTDMPGAIDVVYGNNEAGKSTSRRAVSCFLFEIPVRTPDDFIHPKPTLKLGATVIDSTGASLPLIRRKGAKDTLRGYGDEVVAEDVLSRLLGGLDRELFEQMFSLSRDELVSGGDDLLAGRGSLGEALFGASMGLAGINDLLQALEKEAAEVFKPGGSKPVLNATLRELDEARRRVRELELRPADFLAHEAALEAALAGRTQIDGEVRQLEALLRRLERNKQLLPLAVGRNEISAAIAELGNVLVLSETARQERLDSQREQERADSEVASLQAQIDPLRLQLTELRPNEMLLARADEIGALHSEIGAHRKAQDDMPELRSRVRAARERAKALLAESHPGRKFEEIDGLRLATADRAALSSLSDRFGRLEQAWEGTSAHRDQLKARLTSARNALSELRLPIDVASADAALSAARRLGDIEVDVASEEGAWGAAEARLQAQLETLPLFAGSLDELERLAVPSAATVTRYADAYAELDVRQRDIAAQESRIGDELAVHLERLQALESTGAMPSEGELVEARAHRQQGWQLVRQTLEGEQIDASSFTAERLLPDAFEESVLAADEIGDRLRREADQVAKHAQLHASRARCAEKLAGFEMELAGVDDERARLDKAWAATWQTSMITPLPPSEMQAWLAERTAVISEAAKQRDRRASIDAKRDLVIQRSNALRRELANLGVAADSDASLAELVTLTESRIEEERKGAAAVERASESVDDLASEFEDAKRSASQAQTALSEWQIRWSKAVVKLGLGTELTPEQARSIIEALNELFTILDKAAEYERRIDSISRDADRFAAKAIDLAAEVAPDIVDLAPADLVLALDRRRTLATADAAQVEEIERRLEDLHERQQGALERRGAAEADLERLMKAGACFSLSELELAEDRSTRILELRDRVQAIEEQMTRIGAAPAADLAAQVEGLELDQIEVQIGDLTAELEALREKRQQLDETVGQERALLGELERGDGAAEAAAEVEAIKAAAREQAESYALLKLAIAILRREIERFREESHGPLLARASHFFSQLTCQAFTGLTTGFDERGGVILLGRRASGVEITVDEMSEGTRDQLYLALRLTTIEQRLDSSEPLPLIVDDLFVNFDDERAAAGFAILAELALKTQVIFFTHHRHLVELAQKTLSPGQWALQELPPGDAGRLTRAA